LTYVRNARNVRQGFVAVTCEMSAVGEIKFYTNGQKELEKNIEEIAEKCKAGENAVAIKFDIMQK